MNKNCLPSEDEFEIKEISRCTGHCCDKLWLADISPEELRRISKRSDGNEVVPKIWHFLRKGFYAPDTGKILPRRFGRIRVVYHYFCDYWDANSRKCKNYENRPRVCRDYPFYGSSDLKCNFNNCTYKYKIIKKNNIKESIENKCK